tara:strand:- start:5035 stop:6567 length:1533 start_codon:yes stop_codon:yes gene_type:complete
MALNDYVQLSELGVTDVLSNGPGTATSDVDTGDLRRKYNFGDRVSELAIAQDPFFRFLSKVGKKPTDDPSFKFTEKRGSYHKRYAYVSAHEDNSGTVATGGSGGDADLVASNDGGAPGAMTVGDDLIIWMAADYKSEGNIQNVYGQSNGAIAVGATGTRPNFFLPGQLVKIPMSTTDGGGDAVDYLIVKVVTATDDDKDSRESVKLTCKLVRDCVNTSAVYLAGWSGDEIDTQVYDEAIATSLEGSRCYVVGTAHEEGSGYPETWKDQPYSTQYGYTQIWKTSMAMTNTARATVLKYEGNEWARVWKEKLIEHKWDIETSLLFGAQQTTTTQTTQGAVDYIANYGNVFSLDIATKTADDFLDDMSNYMDPRYNSQSANVFFCNTAVYNWLHKMGGYFKNNLEISPNFRSDIAMTGKKKIFGVDITTFSTPYGDMNVARNIHLDGTNVKLLGIDMKHCAYRPLVGNGVNRDTSVHVGVQTLENSGVDRRVDLILTEAGMEWSMPEAHAMWT